MKKSSDRVSQEWFREWFGELYLNVYRHRDAPEAERFFSKWPLWDRIDTDGFCLDVGCGAGRYAFLLASRGLKTIGLDLSASLLREAQRLLTINQLPHLFFVRGDMRRLPFRGGFALIVNLFTSFGYFESDREHFQLLQQLSRLLSPKGCIILDLPNPEAIRSKVSSEPMTEREDGELRIREERNLKTSPLRVIKRITITKGNHTVRYDESVRLYSTLELSLMLECAGLNPIHDWWGDYDGTALHTLSPRMIFFGEKI